VKELHRKWLAGALFYALAAGDPAFGQSREQESARTADSFKRLVDPTDFKSRIELRNEYQSLQEGGSRNLLVPRFEYAFTSSLAARIDVPYVTVDPDRPGASRESGLGDISVRAQWRALRTASFALVVAPEFSLDTADKPELGTGRYLFQPLAYAAVDLPEYNSVVFPYIQQFWTFGGSTDVEINTTLLRTGFLTRWPQRTYSFVEASLYVDWERDGRTGFTLEAEVGRFVAKSLGVYLRPGVGLWGDNLPPVYNWNLEVGLRYFFY
jgi:hypothetical protein